MKIHKTLKQEGRSLSFEFFVPRDGQGEAGLDKAIATLGKFQPTFVSITQQSSVPNSLESTKRVVIYIKDNTLLEPMPHLTCVEQNESQLRETLENYRALGIENILALRGDPYPKAGEFCPPAGGFRHAKSLVKLASSIGGFSVGVAVYPEGHTESPNLDMDMSYVKEKVDAGSDFAITQMFFQNSYFYDFMERVRSKNIKIPIIAGIMPAVPISRVKRFSQRCGVTLPENVARSMEQAGNSKEDAEKIAIELAIRQCEDLLHNGIRYFHFFTMNQSDVVVKILNNLSAITD